MVDRVDPLHDLITAGLAGAALFAAGVAGGLHGHDKFAVLVGGGDALAFLIAADRAGVNLGAGGIAGRLLGHNKVTELVGGGNDLGIHMAADGAGALALTVNGAGGFLRHGKLAVAVAEGRDFNGLLQVADLADMLLTAGLGAGGIGNTGDLAPAVTLGGDDLIALRQAAVLALTVSSPAVAGAGGLLAVILDPGVALAAVIELILRVDIGHDPLGHGLPLGIRVFFALVLAAVQLVKHALDGLVIGILRACATDHAITGDRVHAGFPIERGRGTKVLALLDEIIIVHDGLKMMLLRGLDPAHDLCAHAAGFADHLHIAGLAAGGGNRNRLKVVHMLLRARRQRKQRQTHQNDQCQSQASYNILFHTS